MANFIPKLLNYYFWMNPKPFYEYYTVYYIRKSIAKKKLDFINRVTLEYFEFDLLDFKKIIGPRLFNIDRTRVFFDLKSFVDQNLKFEKLTLKRLGFIFVIYAGLAALWALLFVLHKLRMFFKSKRSLVWRVKSG